MRNILLQPILYMMTFPAIVVAGALVYFFHDRTITGDGWLGVLTTISIPVAAFIYKMISQRCSSPPEMREEQRAHIAHNQYVSKKLDELDELLVEAAACRDRRGPRYGLADAIKSAQLDLIDAINLLPRADTKLTIQAFGDEWVSMSSIIDLYRCYDRPMNSAEMARTDEWLADGRRALDNVRMRYS